MSYYLNRTARIQGIVASYYRLDYEDMFSPARDAFVSHPRQVAMYLVRDITKASLIDIGRRFRKDHSTVLSGIRAVEKRLKKQLWLEAEIATIRRQIDRDDAKQGSNALRDTILGCAK